MNEYIIGAAIVGAGLFLANSIKLATAEFMRVVKRKVDINEKEIRNNEMARDAELKLRKSEIESTLQILEKKNELIESYQDQIIEIKEKKIAQMKKEFEINLIDETRSKIYKEVENSKAIWGKNYECDAIRALEKEHYGNQEWNIDLQNFAKRLVSYAESLEEYVKGENVEMDVFKYYARALKYDSIVSNLRTISNQQNERYIKWKEARDLAKTNPAE